MTQRLHRHLARSGRCASSKANFERSGPTARSFPEEAVRYTSPVAHFMRTAAADTQIRGRRIARGDRLMLCYPSGNCDEEVFDEPDRFRVDRDATRHVAFGHGAHVCLGQHLARLEMRIFFEELLPRLG